MAESDDEKDIPDEGDDGPASLPDVPWDFEREFQDLAERERFLNLIAAGTHPTLAGIEVGWSPGRTRRVLADQDFAALAAEAATVLDARVEQVIVTSALRGREWAVKLYAFNRMSANWRDVRHIDVRHAVEFSPHLIRATTEVARETLRALTPGAIAELQESFIEADEVDDDDDL